MKAFVEPDEGDGLFNIDANQIEYRVMAHYMKDVKLLEGYKGRDFDLHKFVMDWLGIPRRPAKVINFGTAFNMGKAKLAREYSAMVGGTVTLDQAGKILDRYFTEIVPFLLPTRRDVEQVAKRRGYVKNFFGRHSHLEHRNAYKGFNRVVQGGAAEIVKNRMVAVDVALRAAKLERDVKWRLMVHDEIVFSIPNNLELLHTALPVIVKTLEGFDRMRVPFWWEGAWGVGTWFDVAQVKDDKKLPGQMVGGPNGAPVKSKVSLARAVA